MLKSIKLGLTVAQTGNTTLNYVLVLDNILRWSSAGSAAGIGTFGTMNGPYPANFNAASGSMAQIYAGALVATAASNAARMLSHGILRTAIPVVGDTYTFNFGGHENGHTSLAKNGTAPSDFVIRTRRLQSPPAAPRCCTSGPRRSPARVSLKSTSATSSASPRKGDKCRSSCYFVARQG